MPPDSEQKPNLDVMNCAWTNLTCSALAIEGFFIICLNVLRVVWEHHVYTSDEYTVA